MVKSAIAGEFLEEIGVTSQFTGLNYLMGPGNRRR